jgi:replication factor A1
MFFSAIFNDPGALEAKFPVPVCQCVQIKALAGSEGNPERYRIVLSDVDNFVQSMLATRKLHFCLHRPC